MGATASLVHGHLFAVERTEFHFSWHNGNTKLLHILQIEIRYI